MVTFAALAADVNFGLGFLNSFGQRVDVVGIYANGPSNPSSLVPAPPLASGLINSIIGNTGQQPPFGQMFADARPMKALIRETSKVMDHPVETGAILSDHHIINPVEIDLPLIVGSQSYAATYNQIRQAFINATPLSIKTRVGVYSDMIIADMPHEEDADMFDVITIALRLKQVIFVVPGGGTLVNFQPADPVNLSTIASGLQSATALGSQLLTAATSVASYAALARRL